jgi:hypothetical protein
MLRLLQCERRYDAKKRRERLRRRSVFSALSKKVREDASGQSTHRRLRLRTIPCRVRSTRRAAPGGRNDNERQRARRRATQNARPPPSATALAASPRQSAAARRVRGAKVRARACVAAAVAVTARLAAGRAAPQPTPAPPRRGARPLARRDFFAVSCAPRASLTGGLRPVPAAAGAQPYCKGAAAARWRPPPHAPQSRRRVCVRRAGGVGHGWRAGRARGAAHASVCRTRHRRRRVRRPPAACAACGAAARTSAARARLSDSVVPSRFPNRVVR